MPYRNLMFDLGNVLLFYDPNKALKEMAKHLKPLTAMLLWAKKDDFLKDLRGEADLLETGRMTIAQFFSRLKAKIGLEMELDGFVQIWNDIFTANREMLDLARDLASRYNCYILSNTNEAHYQHVVATFPELSFAKGSALSYKIGAMKPDAEFYQKALESLGAIAEESVFVDDLPANVEGAAAVGMKALHFANAAQLKADLAALGIQ